MLSLADAFNVGRTRAPVCRRALDVASGNPRIRARPRSHAARLERRERLRAEQQQGAEREHHDAAHELEPATFRLAHLSM